MAVYDICEFVICLYAMLFVFYMRRLSLINRYNDIKNNDKGENHISVD